VLEQLHKPLQRELINILNLGQVSHQKEHHGTSFGDWQEPISIINKLRFLLFNRLKGFGHPLGGQIGLG
jgi:hypothetical protein